MGTSTVIDTFSPHLVAAIIGLVVEIIGWCKDMIQ